MTAHRDTINRQIGEPTPSYQEMMRIELRMRFNHARLVARTTDDAARRARAVASMHRIREQLANLPAWAGQYR